MFNRKILIIDTGHSVFNKIESILRKLGYEHIFFVDDLEAVADLFRRLEIDLIIFKLNTGFSLVKIKALFNRIDIPILYLADCDIENIQYEQLPHLYLLLRKPYNTLTLRSAIEIFFQKLENEKASYFGELNLHDTDINWIKIDGNYALICTTHKNHSLRMSMKEILQILPDDIFLRVHRSYTINLQKIGNINLKNKTIIIDEQVIPLGRKYKKELMDRLKVL